MLSRQCTGRSLCDDVTCCSRRVTFARLCWSNWRCMHGGDFPEHMKFDSAV